MDKETVVAAWVATAVLSTAGVGATDEPAASSLERLVRAQADGQRRLPPGDEEDPLALPAWFRVLLRKRLVGLPEAGQPRYPREALEVLSWLEANPDASELEQTRRVQALQAGVAAVAADNARRARYPAEWERPVPGGTALDALRRRLEGRLDLLPERDLEDRTPLPVWFRVYLREKLPDLARSGPYQYPRTAGRMLQRLLDHPNSIEP